MAPKVSGKNRFGAKQSQSRRQRHMSLFFCISIFGFRFLFIFNHIREWQRSRTTLYMKRARQLYCMKIAVYCAHDIKRAEIEQGCMRQILRNNLEKRKLNTKLSPTHWQTNRKKKQTNHCCWTFAKGQKWSHICVKHHCRRLSSCWQYDPQRKRQSADEVYVSVKRVPSKTRTMLIVYLLL